MHVRQLVIQAGLEERVCWPHHLHPWQTRRTDKLVRLSTDERTQDGQRTWMVTSTYLVATPSCSCTDRIASDPARMRVWSCSARFSMP